MSPEKDASNDDFFSDLSFEAEEPEGDELEEEYEEEVEDDKVEDEEEEVEEKPRRGGRGRAGRGSPRNKKDASGRKPRKMSTKMKLILVFGAIFMVANTGVFIWSSQPSFCKECHHIVVHYESWETSTHGKRGTVCTDCHFKPGFMPYMLGKINGAIELVKYAGGAYPVKLRSTVHDISCQRSNCHSEGAIGIPGKVGEGKAAFDHATHAEELRGLKLRCASCHAYELHLEDPTVGRGICTTCHFMPNADGSQADATKCDTCHTLPNTITKENGQKLDHGSFVSSGANCAGCHPSILEGTGEVDIDNCKRCHNYQKHHAEMHEDPKLLHKTHITDEQVECWECHGRMTHGKPSASKIANSPAKKDEKEAMLGNCALCHPKTGHTTSNALYRGDKAGKFVDPMFEAGIQCNGCHSSSDLTKHKDCEACHDKGYNTMGQNWVEAYAIYSENLHAQIKKAVEAGVSAENKDLKRAIKTIAVVDKAGANHNVRYARTLLLKAEGNIKKALASVNGDTSFKVVLKPNDEAASCVSTCHAGVDAFTTFEYNGKHFAHRNHAMHESSTCSDCHNMDMNSHGKLTANVNNCNSCHHKKEANCEGCHLLQESVYRGTNKEIALATSEMAHGEINCQGCHEGISRGHNDEDIRAHCIKCHGNNERFGEIHDDWKQGIELGLVRLQKLVRTTEGLMSRNKIADIKMRKQFDNAIKRAHAIIRVVEADSSGGIHNLDSIDNLIESVGDILEELLSDFEDEK